MLIEHNQKVFDQAAYWLVIRDDQILLDSANNIPLATANELFVCYEAKRAMYLGALQGKRVYSINISQVAVGPENALSFVSLIDLIRQSELTFDAFSYAAKAIQFQHFLLTHKYCGRCGKKMQAISWELAMQCKPCQHRCYPKLHPCVIMAVIKGDQLLLAKNKRSDSDTYSILAGFVEPGETLEHAVAREIEEEVSIKVKNIRYFGSQPWPFPHQLMVGFIADYDSGEIQIDEKEISAADWYNLADLPKIPGRYSIAGEIIRSLQEK